MAVPGDVCHTWKRCCCHVVGIEKQLKTPGHRGVTLAESEVAEAVHNTEIGLQSSTASNWPRVQAAQSKFKAGLDNLGIFFFLVSK